MPEPENNLYSDMLALMKGVADISIDYWGVNYERSKLVDFSYPAYYTGIYIFSGKTTGFLHADLIMGVFDYRSYLSSERSELRYRVEGVPNPVGC